MADVLFESNRYFKTWQYTVGHCRLLLRSTRDKVGETRIDVHFGGVRCMLLRPYYDGLTVRSGTDADRRLLLSRYGLDPEPGELFVLAANMTSFVVSGPMQWHEDDGDVDDPSWFGHMIGTV
jgi:hypothetical protein